MTHFVIIVVIALVIFTAGVLLSAYIIAELRKAKSTMVQEFSYVHDRLTGITDKLENKQ